MSMEDLFGSDIESEEEDSNDVQADSYEGLQSTQAQMQDLFGDSPEADATEDVNHQEESEEEEEEEEEDEEEDEDDGNDQQQEEESNEGYEDESGPVEAGPSRDEEEEEEDEEEHEPGDNRDESNDETAEHGTKPTQEDLFGEELDVSSDEEKDDDEKSPVAPVPEELDDLDQFEVKEKEAEAVEEGQEEEPVEEEGHVINIELPRLDATIGKELYFVKLPNFLSIETKPFDPNFYEDEIDDDEVLDEEGRARLKLKVENTVRWRNGVDKDGNEIRESNARVVRWSDGSLSLHLGNEVFDIFKMKIQGEQNHLFVQQGTGLQSRAVFKEKLNFRPHSTTSQTHRKMTMSIADRMSKAQKIRVVPAFERDPESQRQEMIKKEEERVRALVRRESQQRRIRERSHAKGLTPAYLEGDYEDGDEQELEESLAAIKNKYKKELTGKGDSRDVEDVYSNDESDGDEKLMNAKVDISSEEEGPRGSKRRASDELTRKKKTVKKIIEDSDEEED